jgi:hypothetical protein
MRADSVDRALRLPLRLHGIQLGQPVDVLLDRDGWRTLGFQIRCGDGSERFVPFATAKVGEDEIAIGSALMLLEEVDFYRSRATSFRGLVGSPVAGGVLRDLLVAPDGTVAELVIEEGGRMRRVPPAVARGRAA